MEARDRYFPAHSRYGVALFDAPKHLHCVYSYTPHTLRQKHLHVCVCMCARVCVCVCLSVLVLSFTCGAPVHAYTHGGAWRCTTVTLWSALWKDVWPILLVGYVLLRRLKHFYACTTPFGDRPAMFTPLPLEIGQLCPPP